MISLTELRPFTRVFCTVLEDSRVYLRSRGWTYGLCCLVLPLESSRWVIIWFFTGVKKGLVLVPEAYRAPGSRNVEGSHRCGRLKLVSGGTATSDQRTRRFAEDAVVLHVALVMKVKKKRNSEQEAPTGQFQKWRSFMSCHHKFFSTCEMLFHISSA